MKSHSTCERSVAFARFWLAFNKPSAQNIVSHKNNKRCYLNGSMYLMAVAETAMNSLVAQTE
ncbi:hypothetical protein BpHYR1_035649 [Brachionus plicatilis]|uniref:Uncharacterized protein n=1 Tax=Brachionus plicatilis TaxID=10195 RepID=A0A3M7PTG2_BRAPC|nr:hypothetical protein BpHYR1_035649 [Brachionus plicatilis]